MAVNILPWLLHGRNREEYAGLGDWDPREFVSELVSVLVSVLVLIACRCLFNRITHRSHMSTKDTERDKVLEEMWTFLGNVGTLALAIYVMLYHNSGCWFGDTDQCLVGWPQHEPDSVVLMYYTVEFAWYIHLLLKKPLRYGEPDGKDMMMHHMATLVLIVLSKACNLMRAGVLVLTLFSVSNPFLHAAKICNQILPSVRVAMFSLFSLLFLLTRVIMVPPVILRLSIYQSMLRIPYAVEDFHLTFMLINALLVLLYLLQLKWMWAILRVLTKSATEGAVAAGKLSTNLDPSKRFT
jgi:hypothetical protein